MANKTIKADELDNALQLILDDYEEEIMSHLEEDLRAAGKLCKEELIANSPRRGHDKSHYADGWNYSTKRDVYGHIVVKVKNTSKPALTHLLEKGHVGPDGKSVPATPHIKPAADKAIEELERRLRS